MARGFVAPSIPTIPMQGRLEASPCCVWSNRQVSARTLRPVLFCPSLSVYSEMLRFPSTRTFRPLLTFSQLSASLPKTLTGNKVVRSLVRLTPGAQPASTGPRQRQASKLSTTLKFRVFSGNLLDKVLSCMV